MIMNWSPLIGAAQIATGRPQGLARFGDTPQAFLAALAPWLAFPLVGALALLVSGNLAEAATTLCLTLVGQLSPAILSHALAARWQREAEWLRYAIAFVWCQWVIMVAFLAMLVATPIMVGIGLTPDSAATVLGLALGAYGLWLHWTLARNGLLLSRGRAAVLVLVVNVGTAVLVMAPLLLHLGLNGSSE